MWEVTLGTQELLQDCFSYSMRNVLLAFLVPQLSSCKGVSVGLYQMILVVHLMHSVEQCLV